MALKLKWKNPNVAATTVDIYRGDTTKVDLTTPIVSLAANELEWIDTTALFGKTYYYVWAVNTANDRVVSQPQKIEVNDRKGPGSNILLHGTESYGFFGQLPSADFVNTSALYNAAKTQSGIPSTVLYPTWYKFIRKGKVLFVPSFSLGDVTWQNLYNAGFIYGVNNNGPEGAGSVNQLSTFELNGDLFLIRSVKGYPDGLVWDGDVPVDFDTYAPAADHYSEYEDLLYPLVTLCPIRQRMVNVAADGAETYFPGAWSSSSRNNIGVACQEIFAPNYCLGRGGGYDSRGNIARANVKQVLRRTRTESHVWWPVVEYIGRVGEVDLAMVGV